MSIITNLPSWLRFKEKKMNFKIKVHEYGHLNEVGQINPIRWQILKEVGDGEFETQSPVMKCSDYFNDAVAKKVAGTNINVYGFNNEKLTFEKDGGLLVEVTNLKANFLENLAVINEQLRKDLGCEVTYLKDDRAATLILHFPEEVLSTTFRTSLLCWVIRLGNYGGVFKSWADIWTNPTSPALTQEAHLKGPRVALHAAKMGFKVAPDFEKMWWFCGPAYNSDKLPNQGGITIHNNGCASWCNSMPV